VSFELAAGETLAIIGPSAAGKSTLVRLLLGLWQPESGCVRLDGASLADWPREALGSHLGYLPQDIGLLAGSVAENIARMAPVAEHSEAIVAAARMAGAHELILRLPQGYGALIGDGGAVLSGGQRQRIALARALFGATRLLLLDEPNSNLDAEGEQALVEALRALKSVGSTVVFVTHKPALLNQADRVLVLDAGSVLACGPRDAVLARLQAAAGGPGSAVAPIGRAA
jgi:ABC-type protease/lipase transport system fused ATPase/permease subunit